MKMGWRASEADEGGWGKRQKKEEGRHFEYSQRRNDGADERA
jgi:hypothetical protein